jgi:hypothetical protein
VVKLSLNVVFGANTAVGKSIGETQRNDSKKHTIVNNRTVICTNNGSHCITNLLQNITKLTQRFTARQFLYSPHIDETRTSRVSRVKEAANAARSNQTTNKNAIKMQLLLHVARQRNILRTEECLN